MEETHSNGLGKGVSQYSVKTPLSYSFWNRSCVGMEHSFINLLNYYSENPVSQDQRVNPAVFSLVEVFYLALN